MVQGLKVAEAVARMKEIDLQARELVDDWILITYDIPVNDAGKEARAKFLRTAPRIGAKMHSRSVYLMPNTQQAQIAAVALAEVVGGEVYIWTSKVDEGRAKEITNFYDKSIAEEIQHIEERIQKENELILAEKYGLADRMHRKTANLYQQLLFSVAQRGASGDVVQKLTTLEAHLDGDQTK